MRHAPLFSKWLEPAARRHRRKLLVDLLESGSLSSIETVLDVGGTVDYWRAVDLPLQKVGRLVLLNTFYQQVNPPFEAVIGDARDLSRYGDREFDMVFSNSVLGQLGSFSDQLLMAREVQRVGKAFFLQTPNHSFPLDWRTLVPFFHFLPAKAQAWCFERFPVGCYRKALNSDEAREWATRIRDIQRGEVALLFPGAKVIEERILGFTKSFMIYNF